MKALSWILGVVSVLGVAGAIAAIVLVPAVAMPILQNIVARILSCRPCLYAVAIIAACITSWWFGHHQAVLDCRAGELAAELRNKQADLDNARKSAADEAARATTIEASANDQRSKDAAYIATLEARPACALDESDLGGVPGRRKSRPGFTKPAAGAR
jgi:apolipoprotein N-acyltransferase